MSKMSELSYDIEQLYLEGYTPSVIAALLECNIDLVYEWLEELNIDQFYGQEQVRV